MGIEIELESPINKRFIEAVDYLARQDYIKSIRELGRILNENPQSFTDIRAGKKRVQEELIEKLCNKFDFVSAAYIRAGLEPKILQNKLQVGASISEAYITVPLLPISAQGGSLNDFAVQVKNGDELEHIVSPIKGADFAITVSGKSMEPEYPSGSKILVKKINEKAFIEWGKVYVVDTVNGVILKQLRPSEKNGYVKCVSINPEYDLFEINLENDIVGIYRVLMIMSLK